jgi:GTP-binding protein
MKVELIATAYKKEQIPDINLPIIAFAGRSNVGKSTLINKLLNKKNLARVSKNPGKTVSINYYKINESLVFVDLPGYGYAKQSSTSIKKWGELIESFLNANKNALVILLLLDVRRGITELDFEMYRYIQANNIKFYPVLTKIDKVSRNTLNKTIQYVSVIFNCNKTIHIYSYNEPSLLDNLWNAINKALLSD